MEQALRVGVLCNTANLGNGQDRVGDTMELALLDVAVGLLGHGRKRLSDDLPEIREHAFDPDFKMKATVHDSAEGPSLPSRVRRRRFWPHATAWRGRMVHAP